MKTKTIKAVIRKKIDAWLGSIEDEDLRKLAAKNTIVTGGCIASMLLREKVNDFDIYFRTRETAEKIAIYYVDRFKALPRKQEGIAAQISVESENDRVKIVIKSAGIASDEGTEHQYQYFEGDDDPDATAAGEYVGDIMTNPEQIEDTYQEAEATALESEAPSYQPVFLSSNAITLSGKIQLITRFFGDPDEIHENYDFVHCTNYWTSWDNALVLRQDALEALLTRELRYVGSKYPICSLIRVRKFVARKWTINAGQILKMCMQVDDLDLNDVDVLEEQLTGVDVAYFHEVIDKLKAKDKVRVESAYLLEIIDRLF